MGATNLSRVFKAKDQTELKEKFRQVCEQSRIEDGTSYSGCWGMKHNVKVVTSKHTDVDDIIEELEEKVDKWSDALAVKLNENEYIVVAEASC